VLHLLGPSPEDHGCWNWDGSTLTITEPNCVVDAIDNPGMIDVQAPNATISRTRVTNTVDLGPYPTSLDTHLGVAVNWDNKNGNGLLIEDSEITGAEYCIAGSGFTLERVNAYGCAHEVQIILGGPVHIFDSWLHDSVGTPDAHTDVIQSVGAGNIVIRHNTLALGDAPGAFATISLMDDSGCGNVIDDNWLDSGGWAIGVQTADGCSTEVTNNRFGRNSAYGLLYEVTPIVQSNNVWVDTGEGIQL
jgi:hypothetical protein